MDIMVNRGLVGCIPQHVSEVGVGVIIKVGYKMTYFSIYNRDENKCKASPGDNKNHIFKMVHLRNISTTERKGNENCLAVLDFDFSHFLEM